MTEYLVMPEEEMQIAIPSYQSEEALLGAVMRDGRVYEQAREIVQAESFQNHAYGFAWLACEALFLAGMMIDTITIGDELERTGSISQFSQGQWSGRDLLSKLRQIGDPKNVLTYAANVQNLFIKRKLDPFLLKAAYWAKNGRSASDIIADINTEFSKIVIYSTQDEYTVPISKAVSEAYDAADNASKGIVTGIKTGLIDLDKIYGSLQPENIYAIAGRPGMGKTGLLLTIAKHAAQVQNKHVAIFSLEMSRRQVAQRLISMESKVDSMRIQEGKMADGDWPAFTKGVEIIADLPIHINDISSININQIRQISRKLKAANGLDLIILDYLQLANGTEKKAERRDLEISEIMRGLKYLARELVVPVLAGAQLNRAAAQRSDKRPVLSDLRESGSIEQDSYGVIFLHKENENSTQVEAIAAKHRNGPTGSCELVFIPSTASFQNSASNHPYFSNRKDLD